MWPPVLVFLARGWPWSFRISGSAFSGNSEPLHPFNMGFLCLGTPDTSGELVLFCKGCPVVAGYWGAAEPLPTRCQEEGNPNGLPTLPDVPGGMKWLPVEDGKGRADVKIWVWILFPWLTSYFLDKSFGPCREWCCTQVRSPGSISSYCLFYFCLLMPFGASFIIRRWETTYF